MASAAAFMNIPAGGFINSTRLTAR